MYLIIRDHEVEQTDQLTPELEAEIREAKCFVVHYDGADGLYHFDTGYGHKPLVHLSEYCRKSVKMWECLQCGGRYHLTEPCMKCMNTANRNGRVLKEIECESST